MSKQFKNGTCSCWKKVDRELEATGTALELSFSISGHQYLNIATYRKDGNRKQPKRAIASHCPFCGEALRAEITG